MEKAYDISPIAALFSLLLFFLIQSFKIKGLMLGDEREIAILKEIFLLFIDNNS